MWISTDGSKGQHWFTNNLKFAFESLELFTTLRNNRLCNFQFKKLPPIEDLCRDASYNRFVYFFQDRA